MEIWLLIPTTFTANGWDIFLLLTLLEEDGDWIDANTFVVLSESIMIEFSFVF